MITADFVTLSCRFTMLASGRCLVRLRAALVMLLVALMLPSVCLAQRVAVLDFELNDLTLAPGQPAEVQRTASLQGLLADQLAKAGIEVVTVPLAEQQAADKGHGYLWEHPELAAGLGVAVGADYVVVGRLHKPSFLFAYIMAKVVAVDGAVVLGDSVTETKGNVARLTAKAVENLAEKVQETLAAAQTDAAAQGKLSPAEASPSAPETLLFPVHTVMSSGKAFDDVIDDLLLAISGYNFRLTEHAKIGEAIAEREDISFPKVTVLHFCNLDYARQLLELAPELVLRMPCRISISTLADGSLQLQVLLLPEDSDNPELNRFAKTINGILLDILEEGAA